GASPMKTGFASWKIAKGLYIIPIVMAYRPLLGNGTTTEVIMTIFFTTIGLIAFTSTMERFLFKHLSIIETLLMATASLTLFWPNYALSGGGVILFSVLAGRQYFVSTSQTKTS
ncbi:TRAP transporter permease, partial [bacterium]|nr:TRAP transporter permease [bacterium]